LTLWQLTKAKLTGRGSFANGAVIVRPTRLPFPAPSVKRYRRLEMTDQHARRPIRFR